MSSGALTSDEVTRARVGTRLRSPWRKHCVCVSDEIPDFLEDERVGDRRPVSEECERRLVEYTSMSCEFKGPIGLHPMSVIRTAFRPVEGSRTVRRLAA